MSHPADCKRCASFDCDQPRCLRIRRIIVTANDVFARLKLYFEHIEPPSDSHLERVLTRFRRKRLIRFQRHEDAQRFGES